MIKDHLLALTLVSLNFQVIPQGTEEELPRSRCCMQNGWMLSSALPAQTGDSCGMHTGNVFPRSSICSHKSPSPA